MAPTNDPHHLSNQYRTDEHLCARIETHQRYTVGPALEPAIRREIALDGDEALLDIGTGPGDWPGSLRRDGHRGRLVGVDSSPGMVAAAKSKWPGVEFFQCDAQQISVADESFDLVTARHMLYHVPDIPQALGEARRLLRPGGKFFAVTNAHRYMGEYLDALAEAAKALEAPLAGALEPLLTTPASADFTDVNGPDLVRDAFGAVTVSTLDSVLRFDQVDPVMRYFNSMRTMKGLREAEWARIADEVRRVVTDRLAHGAWIVPKRIIMLSARRA